MPLVIRQHKHEAETAFARVELQARVYVPRHKVRPTDRVIPVAEIDDQQLADLAQMYPDEYEAHARQRGITIALPADTFAALGPGDAIKVIKSTDDESILAQYFVRELQRVPRRPAVMRAFKAKGFDPETFEEDEEPEVDTSDLDDEEDEEPSEQEE
jgi:hypothetical protein